MAAARGCWGCGRVWDPAGCNRGHLLWRRCLMLCRFSFALRLGCADARSSLAFAHPSSIFRVTRRGGGAGGRRGRARCRAALFLHARCGGVPAQPGLVVVIYTCARASFCSLAVSGIVHLVAVVRNAAPRCLVCSGRALSLSQARRELAARWALPSWVGCIRIVACVCVRSALAGAPVFRGVDRAVPRAAAPG